MQKLIIANWKMNLSVKEAVSYIKILNKDLLKTKVLAAVAAPYTFMSVLSQIKNSKVLLAAQDVAENSAGAFTGEVSASMLAEFGTSLCLVGHSERRIYFKETDEMANNKIKQLLSKKITAVLCVGETDLERQQGKSVDVIKRQIRAGLADISGPAKIVMAYEPVWAISTFQKSALKLSAALDQIEEIHLLIKRELVNLFGPAGKKIKVLYGGSVTPQNAPGILNSTFVDGVLVGGASLKEKDFFDIISSVK